MSPPYEELRLSTATRNSEERRYRLVYFIDNQTVGVYLNVIIVITMPSSYIY